MPELTNDKLLVFDNEDLRELEDPLSTIDSSKYDGIKELKLEFCQINAAIVGNLMLKLKNVKELELRFCENHEIDQESVPEAELKLDRLTMGMDAHDPSVHYYDCYRTLNNPKIKLPAKSLVVDRFERPMIRCGNDKGSAYWNWFDPQVEYATYLTWYVNRFQNEIKSIFFDSGRPKIWNKLVKANDIKKIKYGICRNHDARGL